MKKIKRFFYNKKGIAMAQETIGWWIIGIAVLVIMIGGYIYLKEYMDVNIIQNLKNMFRFGGGNV